MLTNRPRALLFAVAALAAVAMLVTAFPDVTGLHGHLAHAGGLDSAAYLASPVLVALIDQRKALVTELGAMIDAAEAENRDFTAEEQAAFDAKKAEKDGLDKRIARLQDQAASTAALDAVRPAAARGLGIVHSPGDAVREFSSLGEFMHAVRFRPSDQRLDWVENAVEGDNGEQRAELRTDDGPSGGFAIPPQFRAGLLALTPQQAIVRPRATVIEAGTPPDAPVTMAALDQGGAAPQNWYGGVQVAWIGEGDTKPETNMKLREITWTPHEVAGVIIVTDKLLRNWGAASSLLETQLRGAVVQAEDVAFQGGNGVGKPLGFLRSGATIKVPRAVANAVSYDDVVNMVTKLYGQGIFGYSRGMLGALMKLKDGQGRPLWVPSMREGEPATLMGLPAIENDRNPALGQMGDLWAADLSKYVIKDGSGPFVAASEHVLFQQNKTMIKIFWNVDGSPWLKGPITLENGDQVSPFVALDVPAA